jgi:hypothetical protein
MELSITGTNEGGVNIRVRIGPPGFVGDGREGKLLTTDVPLEGTTPIEHVGKELLQRLEAANPEIATAVQQLKGQPPEQVNPLYLNVSDAVAASMPWEMLNVDDEFLALQPSWPIARISEPRTRPPARKYILTDHLQIVAVLSALGESAEDEWAALSTAVAEARAANPALEIRVTVLVGQLGLRTAIDNEIAAGANHVTVDMIPASDSELRDSITAAKPHVLHIFSHGSAEGASRRLHFGTAADWVAGSEGKGSLNVGINHLAATAVAAGTWLVVINACEGGTATPEGFSFAGDLVRSGVPAAIGHRTPISPVDAKHFCTGLYPRVLTKIAEIANAGGSQELEWADVLFPPRSKLKQEHGDPAKAGQWALPILHVRDEAFLVQAIAAPTEDAKEEIAAEGTLSDAMGNLAHLDLPPSAIEEIVAILSAPAAERVREMANE